MTMLTKQLAAVAAGVFGSSGLEIDGLPSAGLAIDLMTLVFFSDHSGRDDDTSRAVAR